MNILQQVDRKMATHALKFCRAAGIPFAPQAPRDPWPIVERDPASIIPTGLVAIAWHEYPSEIRVPCAARMPGWLQFEMKRELEYQGQPFGLIGVEAVQLRGFVTFRLEYRSDAARRTEGMAI